MLVAEGTAAVPFVGDTLCLLGHEVGDHVGRGSEIASSTCWRQKWTSMSMCREAGLLAGCSAMVMAPLLSQNSMVGRLSEAEITQGETQVECFFGTLRESVVFGLLGTETYGGAELDFPTAGGAIQKEKIRTSGFTLIEIGGPVTVREAVWLDAVQWVVGAEDKAEVLGADQVFGSTMVGEPELLVRIMDISSQDAHCMRQVGSGPNREADEFAMGSPDFGAQVDVDFGRCSSTTIRCRAYGILL